MLNYFQKKVGSTLSAAKSKKSGAQPTINKERKETVLDPATRNLLLSGTSSKVYKVMSTSVSEISVTTSGSKLPCS